MMTHTVMANKVGYHDMIMGDDTLLRNNYGYDTKVSAPQISLPYGAETLYNLPLSRWAHDDTHDDLQFFFSKYLL